MGFLMTNSFILVSEKVLFSGLLKHLRSNGEKMKEGYKGSYFKKLNLNEFTYRFLVTLLM